MIIINLIFNFMFNNFTETELTNERWKDIDGYDGAYQVSDLGRVRSLKYGKVRVLRPSKNDNGYLKTVLFKDGDRKQSYVHRLVAQAFIENDDETKIYINHRDECKQNNRVSNLEYCTPQYNTNYNDVQFRKKNSVRRKIEKLYRQNLSYKENYRIFKENGIECCEETVRQLRRDLNLEPYQKYKRNAIKDLYRPYLSINENIKIFKANGIECSNSTVIRLRKDLGLTRKHKPYSPRKKTN